MQAPDAVSTPEQTLLVARVVNGALIFGLLAFAVVVWLVTERGEADAGPGALLAASGCVLAAGLLVSALVTPLLARGLRAKRALDEAGLAKGFFSATLIRSAALEGAGFLCLIVYMLEAQPLALAGAAVALLSMVALFPTRAALERFRARVTEGSDGGLEPR